MKQKILERMLSLSSPTTRTIIGISVHDPVTGEEVCTIESRIDSFRKHFEHMKIDGYYDVKRDCVFYGGSIRDLASGIGFLNRNTKISNDYLMPGYCLWLNSELVMAIRYERYNEHMDALYLPHYILHPHSLDRTISKLGSVWRDPQNY